MVVNEPGRGRATPIHHLFIKRHSMGAAGMPDLEENVIGPVSVTVLVIRCASECDD